jgi:hypothetical protein
MGIKCYKFFHARLLSSGEDFRQYNLTVGVALSYFHSCESRNPGKHWISGQARNDKLHGTYAVMYNDHWLIDLMTL